MTDFAGPLIELRKAAHEYALAMESREYVRAKSLAIVMEIYAGQLVRITHDLIRVPAGDIEYQSWFA